MNGIDRVDICGSVLIDHVFAAFTLFVAVTFPFFGDLLGFFGGFGFTPTSFFVSPICLAFSCILRVSELKVHEFLLLQLPCILWLKIKKPRTFSASWFANWVHTTS